MNMFVNNNDSSEKLWLFKGGDLCEKDSNTGLNGFDRHTDA